MAYAEILGGGTGGRYTVRLDYGAANRTAVLAALSTLLAKLDTDIASVQVKIAEQDATIADLRAALNQAITDQISAIAAGGAIDTASFRDVRRYFAQAQADRGPLERLLSALKFDRAAALRDIAKWTAFNPISERDAWCVDFTEDGAGYVATLDINGESDLVVLAPGCRAWQASDGMMTARELQAPHQVFLNAALLPGWQKFMPTYRWGTLTGINYDADTGDVALADARSSAQQLPINQASALAAVPIVYMDCHAEAFEIDDRVVVQFLGQDWSQPRIVGFLDNPRECAQYTASYYLRGWYPYNNGNAYLATEQEATVGDEWLPYTAPDPAAPYKFIGWQDGVATRERSDGEVTESIERTANYTAAPDFTASWSVLVVCENTGDPYFEDFGSGPLLVWPFRVRVTGGLAYTADGFIAATPVSPTAAAHDYIAWEGVSTRGGNAADVMTALTVPGAEEHAVPAGPLYLGVGQVPPASLSFVFKLPGSDNEYTVTGDRDPAFPYADLKVPPIDVSTWGISTSVAYSTTAWSAVYIP